jgi:drug/metabolite transporter, DME family
VSKDSPRSALLGRGFVALAATSWGTWSLFFRPAERLGPLSPQLESLAVYVAIAVVASAVALRGPRSPGAPERSRNAWLALALFGVLDAANTLLFFQAMQLTTVAIAVLTHSVAPLLVAALAPWVTKEPPRLATWIAVLVALLGLALLLEPWRSPAAGALLGAAAGGASAVLYAACIFLTKRLGRSFSPPELAGYHAAVGAVVIALAVPAGGFAIESSQAAILLAAGLGPGALAALCFTAGVARVEASVAAVLALLEPLVATIIGVAVWGEAMGPLSLFGAAMVVGGVGLTLLPSGPRRERA